MVRAPELSVILMAMKIPHILEVHEASYLGQNGLIAKIVGGHRSGIIRWLLPITKADAVFLAKAGAAPDRIHVSPSGVSIDDFSSVPQFDPGILDRPRFVYLGRISVDRGLDVFREIARRGIGDVTLVGEQDDSAVPVPNLNIHPFVPHSRIPAWYERCDVVLLPYQRNLRHAGSISPIKLFEAMAAGRPIIASDLPPIREVIEHERTGLLVRPEDMDGWIGAVRRLQTDRGLAVRIASGARDSASRYSWRRRAEGIARAAGWIK